jgi:hypothetical protein
MKIILTAARKRLAALLRLAPALARRSTARPDRSLEARRSTLPLSVDLMRIPAYRRRRRLAGRMHHVAVRERPSSR